MKNWRLAGLFWAVLLVGAASAQVKVLFNDDFADGLQADLWDADVKMVTDPRIDPTMHGDRLTGINNDGGGYLAFWDSKPQPSIYSKAAFERAAGRCLAITKVGSVHRAGPWMYFAQSIRPEKPFEAGLGWFTAQRQGGPYINSAAPFADGIRWPGFGDNNVDTLFMTVLRKEGAFFLMAGPAVSAPNKARLCFVSHTGSGGPYHAAIHNNGDYARFASVTVADLGSPWDQPGEIALVYDTFNNYGGAEPFFGKHEKGTAAWIAEGTWTPKQGLLVSTENGSLTLDAQTSAQYVEAKLVPTAQTQMAGLILQAHDPKNCLRFDLTSQGARLIKIQDGQETPVARFNEAKLTLDKPTTLAARVDGNFVYLFVDDNPLGKEPVKAAGLDGTKAGIITRGGVGVDEFAIWPTEVDIPRELHAKIPPVPDRLGDENIIIRDEFTGTNGASLDGRTPDKAGKGKWMMTRGKWTIQDGAAVCEAGPARLMIDTGVNDYDVSMTLEMVGNPDTPGMNLRADKADFTGALQPRFLWQGGSPEIEIWDVPANTPENNKRWPNRPSILVDSVNISGLIYPKQTHVMRVVVRGNRIAAWCDEHLVISGPTRCGQGTWVGIDLDGGTGRRFRYLDFTVRGFPGK